ncbi:MAG: HEAT repeat domain-containing protein [Nitrospinota bacterium]
MIAGAIGSPAADDLPESSSEHKAAVVTTAKPEQRPAVTTESTVNKPQNARSQPFFSVDEKSGLEMNELPMPGMPGTEDRLPSSTPGVRAATPVENPIPSEIAGTPLAMFPDPNFRNLKSFDELVAFAKYQQDDGIRLSALSVIAMYRNREAIEALLEFTGDANREVRFDAYQRLWDLAAEGHDEDDVVTPVLQQALNHSDPRIAAFAKKALQDLADRASGKYDKPSAPPPPPDDSEFPAGTPPHSLDGAPPNHPE